MFKWIYELKQKVQEKISEKGQGMTEYAIILAVVAVVAVAIFFGGSSEPENGTLGKSISGAFDQASAAVNNIKTK